MEPINNMALTKLRENDPFSGRFSVLGSVPNKENSFFGWGRKVAVVREAAEQNLPTLSHDEPTSAGSESDGGKFSGAAPLSLVDKECFSKQLEKNVADKPFPANGKWDSYGMTGYSCFVMFVKGSTGQSLVLRGAKKQEEKLQDSLKRESELHQKFKHENIVKFFCCFHDDKFGLVQVIERLTTDLSVYMHENDYGLVEVQEWMRQGASGLNYLHEEGIVHGDVKAENLLVTRNSDGQYRIAWADFGRSGKVGETREYPWNTAHNAPEHSAFWFGYDLYCDELASVKFKIISERTLEGDVWSFGFMERFMMSKDREEKKEVARFLTDTAWPVYEVPAWSDLSVLEGFYLMFWSCKLLFTKPEIDRLIDKLIIWTEAEAEAEAEEKKQFCRLEDTPTARLEAQTFLLKAQRKMAVLPEQRPTMGEVLAEYSAVRAYASNKHYRT